MMPVQITQASTYEEYVAVERSEICPFSKTKKWLILQHAGGRLGKYTGDGKFDGLTTSPLRHDSEPKWSRSKDDSLFLVSGNTLSEYLLKSGSILPWKVFSEYSSIRGKGESDISRDGDHLVLCGTKRDGTEEIFVYSFKDGKGPTEIHAPFDGLKISSNNLPIVSGEFGIVNYDVQLANANGHAAVATYKDRPVLLWCSSDEKPVTLPDFPNAVVMIDIETGKQTGLMPFPWAYAYHISTCDKEWCLVSCYDPEAKLPNVLWKVPFDGSKPTLLHQWQSPYHINFQPRASLSRDGRRCVWNVWDGTTCNVWMLDIEEETAPPPPEESELELLDYSQFEGQKFRLEQEFIVRGGKFTATSTLMFRRLR